MTMIQCHGAYSVTISDISDEHIDAEFRRRSKLVSKLHAGWCENHEDKDASDFTVNELRQALAEKGAEAEAESWIEEVYRMVAEGRIDDALHVMQTEVPRLAPPSHERAIADLLSYGRA